MPFGLDGDFSKHALVNRINGDLANDFGNLASRSVTMIGKFLKGKIERPEKKGGMDEYVEDNVKRSVENYQKEMQVFAYHKALQNVFEIISILNKYIDSEAPWKLAKRGMFALKQSCITYGIACESSQCCFTLYACKSEAIWNALGIGKPIEKVLFDNEKVFTSWTILEPSTKSNQSFQG